MKVSLYVLCIEAIWVLHLEEKIIPVDTRTLQKHNGYVDAEEQQRKLTNFGVSWVTENFDQKVVKADLFFNGFLDEHNLP